MCVGENNRKTCQSTSQMVVHGDLSIPPVYLLLSFLLLLQQNKASAQLSSPPVQTLPTRTTHTATPWLSSATGGRRTSAMSGLRVFALGLVGISVCCSSTAGGKSHGGQLDARASSPPQAQMLFFWTQAW